MEILTLFIKNLGNISANNVVQAVKYLNKDICQLLDINLSLMKEPTLPLGYKKGFSSSDSKKISNSKKIDYFLRFEDRRIITRTYQKEMNLYQYLPPHSSHPLSTLRGMIYSLMRTYFKQNTLEQDYISTVTLMFHHLLARGWDRYTLKDTILAADVKLQQLDQQSLQSARSAQTNYGKGVLDPPNEALSKKGSLFPSKKGNL
ncbi:hypothetical protein ACHAXA_007957 [Cyclostephanos tholiformis]|uniref:Uncharacterized protein n=1 Tax=Cyclostephanos tholiformis TaxID=382380 RepID=A0ABD3R346_9STRA